MSPRLTLLLMVAASVNAATGIHSASSAGWPSDPTLNLRLCSAPRTQEDPRIISDGNGGAFVTWMDFRLTDPGQVYVSHLTNSGELDPGWPVNGLPVSASGRRQSDAAVVSDGMGGLVAVWSNYRLFGQRILADGSRAWSGGDVDFHTGTFVFSFYSFFPDNGPLAATPGGGVIAVWADSRIYVYPGYDLDLYATSVSGTGTVLGPEGGLPVCMARKDQLQAVVTEDGMGGAFVAWEDYRADSIVGFDHTNTDVYAQRLSGTAQAQWAADGVPVAISPGLKADPALLADGRGGVFIAWEHDLGAGISFVALQHLRSDGSVAPGWPAEGLRLTSSPNPNEFNPFLVPDGQGGGIVTWARSGAGVVCAQRFDSLGTLLWPSGGVSMGRSLGQYVATSDSAGGVIVAGHVGDPTFGHRDVYAQRLSASGQRLWGDQGVAVSLAYHNQEYPRLVADGGMGAIFVWEDYRESSDPYYKDSTDVYAQNVQADGTLGGVVTAVAPGLVTATATTGEVVLEWYVGGAAAVEIERRTSAGAWVRVASVFPDGAGRVRYEDRSVTPGERYGYRMRLRTAAGEVTAGETWIEVPSQLQLALEGFVPNPTAGAGVVSFVTAAGAPATLELFGPDGRRVERRDLAGLAPGRHVVRLEAALTPGVYLVRLEQAGERRQVKGVVIR